MDCSTVYAWWCYLANFIELLRHAWFWPIAPCYENTSSTKLAVGLLKVSQRHQRKTEPWPQATCIKIWLIFLVVFGSKCLKQKLNVRFSSKIKKMINFPMDPLARDWFMTLLFGIVTTIINFTASRMQTVTVVCFQQDCIPADLNLHIQWIQEIGQSLLMLSYVDQMFYFSIYHHIANRNNLFTVLCIMNTLHKGL